MRTSLPALTLTSLLLIGCSSDPQAPAAVAKPPAAESRQTPATPALAATPEAKPSTQAASPASPAKNSETPNRPKAAEVKAPTATPTATPTAAPPAATPQATRPALDERPAPAHVPIATDIGGVVEVAATKPGLTRIGETKCKLCHKVQFDSWAQTKHAARTPPLDCESCHGPGSEYKTLAIMKDKKKALAAGLVIPDRSFCSKCHTGAWSDDLLKKAHAHKAGA